MSELEFEATVSKVGLVMAKPDPYGGQPANGKLELVLLVEQPKAPKLPQIPYNWVNGKGEWVTRPPDPEGANSSYDRDRASWEAKMEDYRAEVAGQRANVLDYMGLVASASMLGGQRVGIVLTPANQDMLPGFTAALIGEAAS